MPRYHKIEDPDDEYIWAKMIENEGVEFHTSRGLPFTFQKGYLVRYLEEHRPEVEKIMMTMFSPEYVKMTSERTEKIKEDISFGRYAGMPEPQIKDLIIRRYDLTPTYAQNFLDDDSDSDDSRPWAL